MKRRHDWTAAELLPEGAAIASAMGLPEGAAPSPRVAALVEDARDVFLRLAEPRAVVEDIDRAAFAQVFAGEGGNDATTPLGGIHPRADALTLFVGTLGGPVCDAITDAFASDHPAFAYVLDTIASEAADRLAARVAARVGERALAEGRAGQAARPLAYSPGYCGWHVSGQRALFAALDPAPYVGVTLNDSCLMQPLKSVSGVVVVAPAAVHDVGTGFDCCDLCPTRQCQDRLASL